MGEARRIDSSGSGAIQLTYDPEGDLVNNTHTGGGRYMGQWVKLVDASDWSARIIVQGQVVAVVKDTAGTQSTQYLVQDGLGSTVAVAQGNGTLIGRIAYSPWGQFVDPQNGTAPVSATSVSAQTTVTYTGHELIAGTGLIDMGARIYDPETGLFISPDPTVAHPYDSQDLNQYAYVEDNPMTFTDPDGYDYSYRSCYTIGHLQESPSGSPNGPWITIGKVIVCNPASGLIGMDWNNYSSDGMGTGVGPSRTIQHAPAPYANSSTSCPLNPVSAKKIGPDKVIYEDSSGRWEIMSGVKNYKDWPTNNPGAVESGAHSIGSYSGGGVTTAIFPSYATGRAAQLALWRSSLYQDKPTILAALRTWTGKTALPSTSSYVHAAVDPLGVKSSASPKLTTDQLKTLATGQQMGEGWKRGTIICGELGGGV